jgi:hypothetical protein
MSSILRVAEAHRRAAVLSEEKLREILVKLRKKAISSLSIKNIIAALESLGGWSFEDIARPRALRFTSPEGKSFDLPGSGLDDPRKQPSYRISDWLYKETGVVEQISRKLAVPTPDEEARDRAPRTRDNTGSCPCCFGNFKLKPRVGALPTIVLHGFKRPGWGSVQGRCIGVGFAPFELSPEGTKHLRTALESSLTSQEVYLSKLQSGEVTTLYSHLGKPIPKESVPDFQWAEMLSRETKNSKRTIESLQSDIRTLAKLITEWKERPLPKPGTELNIWR